MSASPPVAEPRVPPLAAFLEGWRRVIRAPAVLFGISAVWWLYWRTVGGPAPGALGGSTAGGRPLELFLVQLRHLLDLYAPEVAALFHAPGLPRDLAAALAVETVVWLLISGGILDRYARGRPIRTAAFSAACGVYFFRFLRLAVFAGVPGWALWRVASLFEGAPAARWVLLSVAALLALVALFAEVRSAVEDRRSMIGALAAAFRFVRRRPWRVLALAGLDAIAVLVAVRIQYQITVTAAPPWLAAALGGAFVVLAVGIRLGILASAVVFFQGELAHAGYTAAPLAVWPESPAIEAIDNLQKIGRS